MRYCSTRGKTELCSAAETIIQGPAPDGGLFVPAQAVTLPDLEKLAGASYRERASAVLESFLGGFSAPEIGRFTRSAYGEGARFSHPAVAPLHKAGDDLYFLELWHGPTGAFKDMALQLLPHLLRGAAAKTGEKAVLAVLTATSGDTGKAALEGFRDVPGTRVLVFYPERGVSEVQRRQMVTQEGENVSVAAVRGNFDEAQSGVKEIFADRAARRRLAARGYRLTSANSINWGRLAPQVAYYVSAYLDLRRGGVIGPGEEINFVVPTGNFGNILACFYARRAGLPVHRLICASNTNNVLTGFIRTGVYDRNRPLTPTSSPSMDILLSSNLERLLFELSGHDSFRVRRWMEELGTSGRYRVDTDTARAVGELFWADYAGEEETAAAIRGTYREAGYLIDPHTAVARAVYDKYRAATRDPAKAVIVATASPFKFNRSVARALWGEEQVLGRSEFDLLELLSSTTGLEVPPALAGLEHKPVRHESVIDRAEMKEFVLRFLA